MIRLAYGQRSLVEVLLPDGEKLWDPVLRRIDEALEDEDLLEVMRQALARRHPLSQRRGRPGTPAEAAPINCAGTVLSQPPINTTASIGWARIISSVSMAMRLRKYMLVGCAKLSCTETVGNSTGRPPWSITPRFTAAMRVGMSSWRVPPTMVRACS